MSRPRPASSTVLAGVLIGALAAFLALTACRSTAPQAAATPPERAPGPAVGAEVGAACGGLADLPPCPKGSFCVREACGMNDQSGHCAPRPEACTRDFAPVCGCDGRTYPNRCDASAAGVNVRGEGPCPRGEGDVRAPAP
ncbi:MAG: Kazal-type serine protease inhibitor family protein [Myxococcota bacterium]